MRTVKIRQCYVPAYGQGYAIEDATNGENVWNVIYKTIGHALRDCSDFYVVEVCLAWPVEAEDDFDIIEVAR